MKDNRKREAPKKQNESMMEMPRGFPFENQSDKKNHPKRDNSQREMSHREPMKDSRKNGTEYGDFPIHAEQPSPLVHKAQPVKNHDNEMPNPSRDMPQKEMHHELRVRRLFTLPYNEELTVGREIPNLQMVFNSVAGQHSQAKLVHIPPGEYKGRYRLDRQASTVSIEGYVLGLKIVGDDRPHVGATLVANEMTLLPFPIDGKYCSEAKGLSFLAADNGLMIKYGGENLDLDQLRVEKGDRILLSVEGSEGEIKTLEMGLTGVEGAVLRVGSELSQLKIRSLAFCPNVTFIVDDPSPEPIVMVADASVTFKGIRFSSRASKQIPLRRSIMTAIGASTVNLPNCLFDDIGNVASIEKSPTVNTCILAHYGATILASEIKDPDEGGIKPIFYSISTFGGVTGVTLAGDSRIIDSHLTSVGSPILLSQGSSIYGPTIQAVGSTINVRDDSKYALSGKELI
jgi:hypothetical protein